MTEKNGTICFITGSRAYGYPREDSDVDLVVGVSGDDAMELWKHGSSGEASCRFGKLNLITFHLDSSTGPDRFKEWRRVHDSLVARKPVTREEAVAAFQEAGFVNYGVREGAERLDDIGSESVSA